MRDHTAAILRREEQQGELPALRGRGWEFTLVRMRILLALAAVLSCGARLPAQTGTDLFLVQLQQRGGLLAADSVVRLTKRAGYDNQPAFVPGTPYIFYTVIDSTSRADIWRYDLASGLSSAVTRTTPESEYSPTPMPDSERFSVVRVEADSTQRLWSFARSGTDPRVLLANVKPVGYHAWLDARRVALFVLGNPATLQLADVRTGATRTLASNIGRALQRVPHRNALSFVQHNADSTSTIVLYDVDTDRIEPVIRTLPHNEYHVWLGDGTLISASGSVLYQWRAGDRGWLLLSDLARAGIRAITRIAVSPDGRVLVVVAPDDV